MKNPLNIIGYIAALTIVLGAIFKIEHWPGAGVLIVIGSSFLSFFYLPVFIHYKLNETTKGEKKFINYLGAFCGSVFNLGVLFKIMHWPGAGLLIVISTGLFASVFLPVFASFKINNATENKSRYVLGAIAIAMLTLGVLFKIQHWPGRPVLFFGGFAVLFFGYLPMYIKSFKNNMEQKTKSLSTVFFFISLTAVVTVLSLSGNSNQIINSLGLLNSTIAENTANLKGNTEIIAANSKNTKAMEVKQMSDELISFIQNIKLGIVMAVDNLPKEVADTISFFEIQAKENYKVPTQILVGEDYEKPNGEAVVLKEKIDQFRIAISGISGKANLGLNTGEVDKGWGQTEPWVTGNFYHMPVASVITVLTKLQEDVRVAEFETLSYLNSNPDSAIIK